MRLRRTSAGSTQFPTVASLTAVAFSRQSLNQALTGARTVVPRIRRQHATNCTSQKLSKIAYVIRLLYWPQNHWYLQYLRCAVRCGVFKFFFFVYYFFLFIMNWNTEQAHFALSRVCILKKRKRKVMTSNKTKISMPPLDHPILQDNACVGLSSISCS